VGLPDAQAPSSRRVLADHSPPPHAPTRTLRRAFKASAVLLELGHLPCVPHDMTKTEKTFLWLTPLPLLVFCCYASIPVPQWLRPSDVRLSWTMVRAGVLLSSGALLITGICWTIRAFRGGRRLQAIALLGGTMLGSIPAVAFLWLFILVTFGLFSFHP